MSTKYAEESTSELLDEFTLENRNEIGVGVRGTLKFTEEDTSELLDVVTFDVWVTYW